MHAIKLYDLSVQGEQELAGMHGDYYIISGKVVCMSIPGSANYPISHHTLLLVRSLRACGLPIVPDHCRGTIAIGPEELFALLGNWHTPEIRTDD